ncbi:PAP2 domain protein [Sporothrix brasiliensis 5110]|uniref:PAP2 domain protein n=1 Tax=Sporothrix brasiliensis 5110 TaxID=1398154 RepID=A0A0C2EQY8_9PEZI|nr:PAP2 domain protein [Sporothrix brasiliensis 5110]KIH88749.1 PAP2 domain protein [Sporothrix brasiliensis 5110]
MAPPRRGSGSGSGNNGSPSSFVASLVRFYQIQFFVEPFHRLFFVNDLNISYPHAKVERVPVAMNFVYALFVPLFVILLYNSVFNAHVHKHHVSVLGMAIALILTSTVTDIVKNMVGRPRPDLLARCSPAPGTPPNTLVSLEICTETDHHRLHDGWRSFPSGHASFAFAGLGYTSLFLAGQLKIFVLRNSGWSSSAAADTAPVHVRGDLGKILVCLAPLLGAAMIAISRCQDYRHDVYDVCTGALLGWTIAYWSYRRYWPHLSSSYCDEPYPGPASARSEGNDYDRIRDEEQGFRVD